MKFAMRVGSAVMALHFLLISPASAVETVSDMRSALYGALNGGEPGGSTNAVTEKTPAAGTTESVPGLAAEARRPSKSLACLENGKVTLQLPRVIPGLKESPSTGQTAITFSAEVFSGTF